MFYQKMHQMAEYKFYFAFENADHPMWMTEKFLGGFVAGTIPVIWGWRGAKDYFPWSKSAIHASDFESPKALADYLNFLDKNETAYNEYFEWRQLPPERLNPLFLSMLTSTDRRFNALCQLCKLVANHKTNPNSEIPKRKFNTNTKSFEVIRQ